jgi:hypothetical protein
MEVAAFGCNLYNPPLTRKPELVSSFYRLSDRGHPNHRKKKITL